MAALLTAAAPLPALAARCPRECRHVLKAELTACRAVCPKHRPRHACRSACFVEFKAERATCKAAANPTPPNCGVTTTTTITRTSTTTTIPPCPLATTWGSYGSTAGAFVSPASVAVDTGGRVYVCDGDGRLQKFTSDGTLLTAWDGGGVFVAVDGDGNVYVAGGPRIQKFLGDGTLVGMWDALAPASPVARPSGLAVDGNGNVFVVDSGFNEPDVPGVEREPRVRKFTSNGVLLTEWGSAGDGDGQFSRPLYDIPFLTVAADEGGHVLVADAGSKRVQEFTGMGTFVSKWDLSRLDFGFGGIAIDTRGNVYLSSGPDDRAIMKFQRDGTLITAWGTYGTAPGQFGLVGGLQLGIAVDRNGSVYVADTGNHRIQKFACP